MQAAPSNQRIQQGEAIYLYTSSASIPALSTNSQRCEVYINNFLGLIVARGCSSAYFNSFEYYHIILYIFNPDPPPQG